MIFLLIILVAVPALPAYAVDHINDLIDQQQKAEEQWSEPDELPPGFFWGDAKQIEIYSPIASEGKPNSLCSEIELDELVDLSRGTSSDQEVIINSSLPSVRELLETGCLIRPNDEVLAVGEDWQARVKVKEFVVHRDASLCPQDSPYSLWMTLKEPLPDKPLFFSTDDGLTAERNNFVKPTEIKVYAPEMKFSQRLREVFKDAEDYLIVKCGESGLYILRRQLVSPEDDQLPSEILISDNQKEIKTIWMERIDIKKGSGHLRVEGILDFNHDGLADLIVSGDHNDCPYRKVFRGEEDGFEALDIPVRPCRCE